MLFLKCTFFKYVLFIYLFIYLKIACAVGFKGHDCGIKCTFPTYGQDCQMICFCSKKDCDFVTECRRSLKGIVLGKHIVIYEFFFFKCNAFIILIKYMYAETIK